MFFCFSLQKQKNIFFSCFFMRNQKKHSQFQFPSPIPKSQFQFPIPILNSQLQFPNPNSNSQLPILDSNAQFPKPSRKGNGEGRRGRETGRETGMGDGEGRQGKGDGEGRRGRETLGPPREVRPWGPPGGPPDPSRKEFPKKKKSSRFLRGPLFCLVFSYGYEFSRSDCLIQFCLVFSYGYDFSRLCLGGPWKGPPPSITEKNHSHN